MPTLPAGVEFKRHPEHEKSIIKMLLAVISEGNAVTPSDWIPDDDPTLYLKDANGEVLMIITVQVLVPKKKRKRKAL